MYSHVCVFTICKRYNSIVVNFRFSFQFSQQSVIEPGHDRLDRSLTYPDSIISSYSTSRKNSNKDVLFRLYTRVIAARAPTVFQSRFSGIVAHAVTDVIRSSTPWTGIYATNVGWKSNLLVGPADGVLPGWTSCVCIRRGRAIM